MDNIKSHTVFGITIIDISIIKAIELLNDVIKNYRNNPKVVFFINTHTLNLSISDETYRNTIISADYVFGDGTGVRWAFRFIHKIKLVDNVNGTDLIPLFMTKTSNLNYKCFLLGATAEEIESASLYVKNNFSGWKVAGYHHGYLTPKDNLQILNQINKSGAQLLLVGMGNPLQEQWIYENRNKLNIPLIIGIGGLFTYWAGNLDRAPFWMRKIGMEWLHILIRQPNKKWKRYIFGNLLFLFRIGKEIINR